MMQKNYYDENIPKSYKEKIIDWFVDLKELALFRYFRKKILFRKTLFAGILLFSCVALVVGGVTSPKRVTFKAEQLDTSKTFTNSSGSMELVNQRYSKENGIAVLEFETKDDTSVIEEGIKAENLEWQLFSHQL